MVMKRSMMAKNLRQSIFRSMGRFIAIAVIIALGAAIFVGLRTTKADMVATGQKYMDAQNMFDLRLLSSYGWNRDQVSTVAGMGGVEDAEGVFYTDLIVSREDGEDAVYRFYTMPERINRLVLRGGRHRTNVSRTGSIMTTASSARRLPFRKATMKMPWTCCGIVPLP